MTIGSYNIQQQMNLTKEREEEVRHKRIYTESLYLFKVFKKANIIHTVEVKMVIIIGGKSN